MPREKVLAAYQGAQGMLYREAVNRVPDRMFEFVSLARASKLQPHVDRNARVLEFGVGQGFNLTKLHCREKVGIDVAEFLAPEIEGRGIKFCKDLSPIADNSVDVVICHHVLEHVADPWTTLEEFLRVLKPDGTLLLYVPYEQQLHSKRYVPDNKNGHLFSWTPQTIGTLSVKSGFRLENIHLRKFAYDRFAAVVVDRFRGGLMFYRFVRWFLLLVRPQYEIEVILKKPI